MADEDGIGAAVTYLKRGQDPTPELTRRVGSAT
jgi:hypothetical protein